MENKHRRMIEFLIQLIFSPRGLGLIILIGLVIWGAIAKFSWQELRANIYVELGSVAITILIVDYLIERRSKLQLKSQLIRELGNPDHGIAMRALNELEANGWVEDGSLQGAFLVNANLKGACLLGANLQGAYLDNANLEGADLGGADLSHATLIDANIKDGNLTNTNSQGVDLQGANLVGASLFEANLFRANLAGANLEGASLRKANLQNAELWGANLKDAKLGQALVKNARFENTNLENVEDLTTQQMSQFFSLYGATLQDGNRYLGELHLPGDLEEAAKSGIDISDPELLSEWYSD
jgi:uncharacterized protein YjbI with pentapeptide repeats